MPSSGQPDAIVRNGYGPEQTRIRRRRNARPSGFLVPHLESRDGKVVARDAEMAKASLAILRDETPATALMRIVAAKTADRELARQKAAARYDRQLGATQQAAIGISRVLAEQSKLSELMQQASPAFALKETLGRVGASSTLLAAMGEDSTVSRMMRENSPLRDVASGWTQGLSILTRDRDILQDSIRTALEGQSILKTAGLADALRLSAVERAATGGVLETWRRAETASALALAISGTPSWARSLNRQLDLGLPRAALAGLAIFSAADMADATTLADPLELAAIWDDCFAPGATAASIEKAYRLALFVCLIQAGLRREDQPSRWISDQDEVLDSFDKRERFSGIARYLTFGLTGWRAAAVQDFMTTGVANAPPWLEDLAAIPDIAAGACAQLSGVLPLFRNRKTWTVPMSSGDVVDTRARAFGDWLSASEGVLRHVLVRLAPDDAGEVRASAQRFLRRPQPSGSSGGAV